MMPASPWCRDSTCSSCVFSEARGSTRYSRFGRSNEPTSVTASRRPSCDTMSWRTRAGGGGGVGVEAHLRQRRAQRAELAVLRPEVVAPVADAVRLVDRHEAERAGGLQPRHPAAALAGNPFGRHVEQAIAAFAQAGHHRRPLVRPPSRCSGRPRARRWRRACRPDPSSARSAARSPAPARRAPAPAPGSTATCRRRWAAPAASRAPGRRRPWLRAGAGGSWCSPSIVRGWREGVRARNVNLLIW